MISRRWWDVAVALVIVALAVVAVVDASAPVPARWIVVCLMLGIGVDYVVVLRRCIPTQIGELPEQRIAFSLVGQGIMVAIATAAVVVSPTMMITLTVVLPVIWLTSVTDRQAGIVTVVATTALGAALAAAMGWGPTGVLIAVSIAAITAAFSIAMGLWISHLAAWGSERARILAELTAAQGEVEVAHREAGAAAERERIARDIHDTIAQSLTSIVMLAQRASREPEPDATLTLIEDTARDALDEARGLVAANAAAHADPTDPLGATISRLGERFERETGVVVTSQIDVDALPRELEVVLLRCVQEGLANVRKHARASHVAIILRAVGDRAQLTVTDDGDGLAIAASDHGDHGGGFGLPGMRDRVALVGGAMTLTDRADRSDAPTTPAATSTRRGATLMVTVPRRLGRDPQASIRPGAPVERAEP